MLKLVVLSIAFLVSYVHSQPTLSTIYAGSLSELSSYNYGYQQCTYSSPDWTNLLVHNRFIIQAAFSRLNENGASNINIMYIYFISYFIYCLMFLLDPTIISSIRIRFHQLGSTLSETFVVPRPGLLTGNNYIFLRKTLPSSHWLKMTRSYFSSYNQTNITDSTTGFPKISIIIQDTGSYFKIQVNF